MNNKQAASLANHISADIVIPTHYAFIVGNIEDGQNFSKLVKNKEVKLLIQ